MVGAHWFSIGLQYQPLILKLWWIRGYERGSTEVSVVENSLGNALNYGICYK